MAYQGVAGLIPKLPHSFIEILVNLEPFSTLLIQVGHLSVNGKRKGALSTGKMSSGGFPRIGMARITDIS